ncbi:MAG: hypothetical protein QMC34_08720 [Flavobacteriales bacterium]|jgi:phosphoglycerol transferase MdoB-like AlkP superfamily enzyme|tara:strand:+ start:201 stop:701 length:501 start_codon:yes stop_codon:yes gene_type:complete
MELKYFIIGIIINLLIIIYGKKTLINKNKVITDEYDFILVKNSIWDLTLAFILLVISLTCIVCIILYIPKNHWFNVFAFFIALGAVVSAIMLIHLYRTSKLKYNKEVIIKNNETYAINQVLRINKKKKFFIPMFEVDFDKSKSIIVNSLSQGSIPFIQFIRKENGL